MNQEYKEKLSRKIENNFSTLEERIMEDIVRRIQKTGKITSTADWQINRLLLLGNSSEDIERMLKEALDASYPEMFELYDKVIDWEYVRNKDIYEQVNQRFIPYEENDQLQMLTQGYIRQTKGELENITQSLGFYLDYGNGRKVLTPLAQIYQGYLDNVVLDITSGAFDYNSVLRRTVTQLTNSGLRTINYASGRSYRANVAARMAVMTGIKQLSGQIADMNAEKLGTDYFEVDWHMGARPDHQAWQGRVYSREELVTVCGLGSVTGLEGANCYHSRLPFFPGISVRTWPDEWLDEMNRKENTPKEFQGKEYTVYEAKQKQRRMETAMRAQREKVKLLQAGGADPDEVMLARCKYQGQLDEYARFSKKMGLKQERERIYLDMQGRVAPSQHAYKKWQAEQIEKAAKREASRVRREERARQKTASSSTMKINGVPRGNPMSFEQADTGKVNPKYGFSVGYSINCQSCVPTFEARIRGYNVQAKANTKGSMCETLSRKTNLAWIDPATGDHPIYIFDASATTAKKYLQFVKDTVKQGERYSIEFGWKGRSRSGHIVNLDRNEEGLLRIKDNQRGPDEVSEWIGDKEVLSYLSRMKYTVSMYGTKYSCVPKLLRLDNMEFDYDVVSQIMEGVIK